VPLSYLCSPSRATEATSKADRATAATQQAPMCLCCHLQAQEACCASALVCLVILLNQALLIGQFRQRSMSAVRCLIFDCCLQRPAASCSYCVCRRCYSGEQHRHQAMLAEAQLAAARQKLRQQVAAAARPLAMSGWEDLIRRGGSRLGAPGGARGGGRRTAHRTAGKGLKGG